MHSIVVATCDDTGKEAIYKDGSLVFQDDTVYACDIAAEVGQSQITFEYRVVRFFGEWPTNVGDLVDACERDEGDISTASPVGSEGNAGRD